MNRKILIVGIVVLGFFLRGQELISDNFLFLKDQGRDMLAVKSIVVDHKPTLIGPYTGLQAVFQGPLYYYLLAVPFAFSGGNPRSIMLLLMMASICAIVIGYFIGNKFFGKAVGLVIALLFAASPALGAAATFFWSPFFLIPIVTSYVYFLLKWINGGGRSVFLWLTVTLGIMYHFELAFAVPWTLVTLIVILFAARKKSLRWYPKMFVVTLFLFISPLVVFDVRHDVITTRSVIRLFTGSTQGLAATMEPYDKIVRDHVIGFVANGNAAIFQFAPFSAIAMMLLIAIGIWYIQQGKRFDVKVLCCLPALLFIVYLLYPYQIYSWYLVGLFPIYLVLFGLGLSNILNRRTWKILGLGITGLVIFFSFQKIVSLYGKYDSGGTAKLRGKLDVIDTIYQDARGKQFNVAIFTPVVLTDAYDYLFWWHGQKTYGFVPTQKKQGLTYLLIEPDSGKPWSHEGWLTTVVNGGTIIDTKTLPSGFIVQKRLYD